MLRSGRVVIAVAISFAPFGTAALQAHSLREKGKLTQVANSSLTVNPSRNWNRLDDRPGKFAETWSLDGEQLNDVTFYGGVERGSPLVRELSRTHDPLPQFKDGTLLAEIPELLESTYRAFKQIGTFSLTSSSPSPFLNQNGTRFNYEFVDQDGLPKKGEALATIHNNRLYMITFDAPRMYYFDHTLAAFRSLAEGATLKR